MDTSTFDFDFEDFDRSEMLADAEKEMRALDIPLGPGDASDESGGYLAGLFSQLNGDVADFGASLEVLPFTKSSFKTYGWTVPKGFDNLDDWYKFYWLRLPVLLWPAENSPFVKIECAVEFSPNASDPQQRPKAILIVPDRRFRDLVSVSGEAELNLSGEVDLGATTPKINLQYGIAKLEAGAGGAVAGDGSVRVKVGPLRMSVRRALIEHSPAGAERVFWRVSETRYIREDDPSFAVVLQVPKSVQKVEIAAVLQAYHNPAFGLPVQQALDYISFHLARFIRKGAPLKKAGGPWLIDV